MARQRSIITLSGKIGNQVFVDSTSYKKHVRMPVRSGSRKDQPELKKQYSRTGFLNNLASQINVIMANQTDHFKGRSFYAEMQKLFRKETYDNRFLLLHQLEKLEINSLYRRTRFGTAALKYNISDDEFTITLKPENHPAGSMSLNCYYLELLLLQWDATDKAPSCVKQLSEWITMDDRLPEFDFIFDRNKDTFHWMLCLGQRLGFNKDANRNLECYGMEIIKTGTFNEEDLSILREREEQKKKEVKMRVSKPEENVVRVKRKM